jgi:uncharacterized protein (TIGR03118 family)
MRALSSLLAGKRSEKYPIRPVRPKLEMLEDRCLLAGGFLQTNLVSDIPGLAAVTDPNLINPWGITAGPNGPFWVSDNNSGFSTLYNGQGQMQPSPSAPLVVTIPPPAGSPAGTTAAPTGIVFNSTPGFMVSANGKSGAAIFIFATEDGTISAWSPGVDPTNAILEVDNSNNPAGNGAVYKGLTIATTSQGTFLYAANFRAGTVDVFDSSFHQTMVGSFRDPNLPSGFAPFGIQNIGNQIYVSYAKQNATRHDDVGGAGNGFIDVFDTNGNMIKRLVSQGPLDSPWGMTMAPAHFGKFSNDLLVGNFRDGHINAFDPNTGNMVGTLTDNTGAPITINGLWSLRFGNGTAAGDPNTLFFTAGINDEADGLLGTLQQVQTIVTGADAGGGPQVNVINAVTGSVKSSFFAFDPSFRGGVRVATGDVNGDGVPDIVTSPGPGGSPEVRVFDGKTQAKIMDFMAFDPHFLGGINVAVGEFDGDNHADIVVSADTGGGPEVAIFSGADGHQINAFFAYDPRFLGGVRVAVGDVNGDGHVDLITAAGPGGGPHVKVFDGTTVANPTPTVIDSFMAFDPNFHGGAFVAAGDTNGDGKADIIIGSGAGMTNNVRVFSGADLTVLHSFMPLAADFMGDVRVAAVADINDTAKADIVTTAGAGGAPQVTITDGETLSSLDTLFAYDPHFLGGVFVGGQ